MMLRGDAFWKGGEIDKRETQQNQSEIPTSPTWSELFSEL